MATQLGVDASLSSLFGEIRRVPVKALARPGQARARRSAPRRERASAAALDRIAALKPLAAGVIRD
ncbi:MAG: hypothetical protein CFK52_02145 [Chloracidobacterium sp. CP2_5A]|nr:MAG: hypothetical protein CFK52_02145 [Chloracidobacterium sp. CP2_5A]